MNIPKIIDVKKENCVSCHACIAVCPVKFCNNAIDDYVNVNENLCIGCGECLKACKHEARTYIDDFDKFITDLKNKKDIICVVAPAVAANFPNQYLNLNGWLKSLGVSAFFDVSFGAELTIVSYLEYIKNNHPKCVISQPCPALVTYIEIYQPELIKYLAPADSPMLHTIKMVKEYYSDYKNHSIAVISPCNAKKREFTETKTGDYNVTFKSIQKYLSDNNINLKKFKEVDFDNQPAERAALFSTPGGLLETAKRWNKDVEKIAKKIEGPEIIYTYLKNLPESIKSGYAPILIDCLNCDLGCNGGTGTNNQDENGDKLEHLILTRVKSLKEKYKLSGLFQEKRYNMKLDNLIKKYWKPNLYGRKYVDLSENNNIKIPSKQEFDEIYKKMNKTTKEDHLNCHSCGYKSCEQMAIAIYNNLNKPTNCHDYLLKLAKSTALKDTQIDTLKVQSVELGKSSVELKKMSDNLEYSAETGIQQANENLNKINDISLDLSSFASSIEEMNTSIKEIAMNSTNILNVTNETKQNAINTNELMTKLEESTKSITNIVSMINNIASQTNLLSLNATIEAARAGDAGKGFSVVANEIKALSHQTHNAIGEISLKIKDIQNDSKNAIESTYKVTSVIASVKDILTSISSAIEEQSITVNEISSRISSIVDNMKVIESNSSTFTDFSNQILKDAKTTKNASDNFVKMSKELKEILSKF